jgi:hypothetical protein
MVHEEKRSLGDSWTAILNPPDGLPQCQAWLIGYCSKLGTSSLAISPMPAGSWLPIDPLKELEAMVGEEKVLVVSVGAAHV